MRSENCDENDEFCLKFAGSAHFIAVSFRKPLQCTVAICCHEENKVLPEKGTTRDVFMPFAVNVYLSYELVRRDRITSTVCGKNGCEPGFELSCSSTCHMRNEDNEFSSVLPRIWTRRRLEPVPISTLCGWCGVTDSGSWLGRWVYGTNKQQKPWYHAETSASEAQIGNRDCPDREWQSSSPNMCLTPARKRGRGGYVSKKVTQRPAERGQKDLRKGRPR